MIPYLFVSLITCIAGMIGILSDYKNGHHAVQDVVRLIILSLCLIASISYNCYEHSQTLKKEKYAKDEGTFNFPTDSNEKPLLCFGKHPLNSLTIRNPEWVVEDKWVAWSENKKVNLRGTVRDREGNIVFKINDTDWENWTGKEFNYDERGIEVEDSRGNIIFQLEFNRKENKISIFGILYYGPDSLILMGKDDNTSVVGHSPSSNAIINSFISSMKPIFKYPRGKHPGERVTAK
jgi:hypothetical protein